MHIRLEKTIPALILALMLTFSVFAAAAQDSAALGSALIRLHVVANSDTEDDQALKLLVRDAVLAYISETRFKNIREAEAAMSQALPEINAVAERTVQKAGYVYPVKASIGTENFLTKDYDGFSIPAGDYLSLRLTIGEGQGHNWWCVIFPPLCLGGKGEIESEAAAAGFTDDEVSLITGNGEGYVIRFKVVELLSRVRNYLLHK